MTQKGNIAPAEPVADALKKFEFIVDGSLDFMTLINRSLEYEAVNASFCNAHGMDINDVLGKSVADVWGQKVFEKHIKKHLEIAFAGEEISYEFSMENGKRKWFEAAYFPYHDRSGKITHVAVVSRDITERVKTAEKLRRSQKHLEDYSKRLEKTVEERTKKLSKLVDSQMEFIADISHELRTPLSVVRALTEAGQEDGGIGRTECALIGKKIDQMSDLLRNLMFITRLDLGQTENRTDNFGVYRLIQEAVNDVTIKLGYDATLKFVTIDCDPKMTVRCEQNKLHLVAVNIIKNAFKYAQNDPMLTISAKINEGKLIISFADTNNPIEEKEMTNIFRRFYRSKYAKKISEGSGLGLYICRKLMESMGGKISVSSDKKGNKFEIEVPVG